MKVFAIILSVAIASAVASPQGGLFGGEGGLLNLGEILSNLLNSLDGINGGNFADKVDPNLSPDQVTALGQEVNDQVTKIRDALNKVLNPDSENAASEAFDEVKDGIVKLLDLLDQNFPELKDDTAAVKGSLVNLVADPDGNAAIEKLLELAANVGKEAKNFGN